MVSGATWSELKTDEQSVEHAELIVLREFVYKLKSNGIHKFKGR